MEGASPFISSHRNTNSSNIDKHLCSSSLGAESSSKKGSSSSSLWNLAEPETGSILDPFQIEDLLDFSNEDIAGPIGDEHTNNTNSTNSTLTAVSNECEAPAAAAAAATAGAAAAAAVKAEHVANTISSGSKNEFPIDCGDMPELDWLSSLVEEDSFNIAGTHKSVFVACCSSPLSSSANVGGTKRQHSSFLLDDSNLCKSDRFQVGSPISVLESTSATSGGRLLKDLAVPGRPRSKRTRTGVSSWKSSPSSPTPANNTNMTTNNMNGAAHSCSPDTSSISDYNNNNVGSEQHDSGFSLDDDNSLSSAEQDNAVDSRPPHEVLILVETPQHHKSCSSNSFPSSSPPTTVAVSSALLSPSKGKPPLLKSNTMAVSVTAAAATGALEPRRCTHCLSQKTPQWRAGPEGPKTLCNACGVRFKSGRLFPEYRPALSPTFVSDIHSNSHRKVLEMRKQKHHQRQGEVVDDGVLIYKNSSSLAA